MEPESLTIAILKEIRDNTAQTNVRLERVETRLERVETRLERVETRLDGVEDRLGSLEENVAGLTARVDVMAATQIRQEVILMRLSEASERHEEGIKSLIRVTDRINERIDNLVEGVIGQSVRDHERRIRLLEGRDD